MKKILIGFLFIPMMVMAANECELDGSVRCPAGKYCTSGGATITVNGKLVPMGTPFCLDNGAPPPPGFSNPDNKQNTTTPSCPAGSTYSSTEKKCKPDCMETLAPNKPELRTVEGIKNWWEASKNQIAKKPIVQPLLVGPSISGFAGILPGGPQCVWVYESLEWGAYFDCINTSQAGTLAGQQKECLAQKPKGTPDVRGHFDCDNKKANVFDALWGFLTHRKPY